MDTSKTIVNDVGIDIPGYSIVRELGEGGMATVYLAVQENFDRQVALKVMSQALVTEGSFGERFQREAKIVAKLSHPHIVTVYDVGVVSNHHYIAMEYHSGGDLCEKLQSGVSREETILIIKQIGLALDFAHSKGYIHRDIKPDNILFREDGSAVLTDFGIARPTKSSQQMTQVGKVVGTPKYMSPEQAKGMELDARADLYALGVMFYEMLTGTVPFDGDDPISIGIKHVKDPVPPLPEEIADFQVIIDKLLAKEPADRYQRGQDVISAIEDIELTTTGQVIRAQIDTLSVTPLGGNAIRSQVETMRADLRADKEERITAEHYRRSDQKAKTVGVAAAMTLVVILVGGLIVAAPTFLPQAKPLVDIHAGLFGDTFGYDPEKARKQDPATSITAAASKPASNIAEPQTLDDEAPSAIVKVSSKEFATPADVEVLSAEEAARMLDTQNVSASEQAAASNDVGNKGTSEPQLVAVAEKAANVEVQTKEAVPEEPALSRTEIMVNRLLTEGNEALAINNLSTPEGNNALEKYRAVLAISPKQPQALMGLHNIAEAYVALSKKALEKNKTDSARVYLQKAQDIQPDIGGVNSLLSSIKASEKRQKQERLIAKQRAAEDAAKKRKAETIRRDDQQANLLLNKVRIMGLLRSAQNAVSRGQFTAPTGENAYDKYQQVLSLDPDNKDARDGILKLSDRIIEKSQAALDTGDYEGAKELLIQAIKVNPKHADLDILRDAIDNFGLE